MLFLPCMVGTSVVRLRNGDSSPAIHSLDYFLYYVLYVRKKNKNHKNTFTCRIHCETAALINDGEVPDPYSKLCNLTPIFTTG